MATRPAFYVENRMVMKKDVIFDWAAGFAVSQKKKNIRTMHSKLINSLEISTKSEEELGVKLSAFNLKYKGNTLENIFQSSKVFSNGGPYKDLLDVSPKDAKRDNRLRESGALIAFEFEGVTWPLEPKTAFYDYIYINAVKESLTAEEIKVIADYEYFTDIEFNPARGINTQARTVALIKLFLEMFGEIPDIENSIADFIKFHEQSVKV